MKLLKLRSWIGYDGEDVPDFDQDVRKLKEFFNKTFKTSGWEKADAKVLKRLRPRLVTMKEGDKFTVAEVLFMARIMEREGVWRTWILLNGHTDPVATRLASMMRIRR